MIETRRRVISDAGTLRHIAHTLGVPAHSLGVTEADDATFAAMLQFAESVLTLIPTGRTRRYHLSPQTAGTIAALLTLREQVIAPILAGVRSPRMGRKPITWTSVDRDYEKIRIDMQTLFQDLGIRAAG